MNKLKIYFTKDNSSATASSYAARSKEELIESSTLLGASLSAPFIFLKRLLWDLPQALANKTIFNYILNSAHKENIPFPVFSTVLAMTLSNILAIVYETATTAITLAKAPLHLVASVFNLSLFAMHKFFSLFASESKPVFKPAPWAATAAKASESKPETRKTETNISKTHFTMPVGADYDKEFPPLSI